MNFDPEFGSVGERRRLKQFLQQRGAQFEPEIIDRIRLIQAQKAAAQVPVSKKLLKQQQRSKRKAKRKKNLRGEVARAIREQKRFERGERRDRPEEEPRIVGEPRVVGGVDPEIERERIALQRELQGRREVQAIADRAQQARLQREELAVRRGELAAARAERARVAALPALPPPPAPVINIPPAAAPVINVPAAAAPDVRIGDIAPVVNIPAQPPPQIIFAPDRPEPNIRDFRRAAGDLGDELRGQNRQYHDILRGEAEQLRRDLAGEREAVERRFRAQDEERREGLARQDAIFQDMFDRLGRQEATIGETRDRVLRELGREREPAAPAYDDTLLSAIDDAVQQGLREGTPQSLRLEPESPTVRERPAIASPIAEGIPPTPPQRPPTPELPESEPPQPERAEIGGGGPLDLPSIEIDARPAIARGQEDLFDRPVSEPTPRDRLRERGQAVLERLEGVEEQLTPRGRRPRAPLAALGRAQRTELSPEGPVDLPDIEFESGTERRARERLELGGGLPGDVARAGGTPFRAETPKTQAIRRSAASLRELLESGNRSGSLEEEAQLQDLVEDAEAAPEARLATDSPRQGDVPVAQRVESIEELQNRSGGSSVSAQRWNDMEAEFAAASARLREDPPAPTPTPRATTPELEPEPEPVVSKQPKKKKKTKTKRIEEIDDDPQPAALGGSRVLEAGGGELGFEDVAERPPAESARELEEGAEPLLEEVGSVKNKAQSRIEASKRAYAGAQEQIFSDVRPGPRGARGERRGGAGFRVRNNTDRKLKKVEPGDVVNVLGGHAGNVVKLDTGAGTAGTRVGNAPFQRLIDDGSFLFEEGHRHELGGHFEANPYGPPVEPALQAAGQELEEELAAVEPEVEPEESPGLLQQGAQAVGGAAAGVAGAGARLAGGLAQGVGEGLYAQLPSAQEVGAGLGRAAVGAVSGAGRLAAGAVGGVLGGEEEEEEEQP